MRKSIICASFLILTSMLGCKRGSSVASHVVPSAVIEVVMRNMQFSPATMEIKKGDVVEWKNEDITPHTATSSFFGDSGSLASGKSWRHTFTETGNFAYSCTFHPEMKGVVVVK